MSEEQFYAVRQARSGKVIGSRIMTRAEAEREVAVWREHIGRAGAVPVTRDTAQAVRLDNQDILPGLLEEAEGYVWVSVTSHRARHRLYAVAGESAEFGILPARGDRIARGEYHKSASGACGGGDDARHEHGRGRVQPG